MSPVNCHDARALLMAYLDSELDAATTVSVREHLQACGPCAKRFEGEERVERALAETLREGGMPEDVGRRLDAALLQEARGGPQAEAPSTGDVVGAPAAHERSTPPRGRASAWRWVAAAALVLVALTLVLMDDGVSREEAPAYLSEFVSSWESDAERRSTLPVGVSAHDASAIRSLLDGADLSAFEFPGDGRVHDHAVHLLGAREESFGGLRAVNVLYDCCGELTSVFVLPTDALEAYPGGYEALRMPADLQVDGVHTRTVVRDGVLIGVVSRHASGLAEQWSG